MSYVASRYLEAIIFAMREISCGLYHKKYRTMKKRAGRVYKRACTISKRLENGDRV